MIGISYCFTWAHNVNLDHSNCIIFLAYVHTLPVGLLFGQSPTPSPTKIAFFPSFKYPDIYLSCSPFVFIFLLCRHFTLSFHFPLIFPIYSFSFTFSRFPLYLFHFHPLPPTPITWISNSRTHTFHYIFVLSPMKFNNIRIISFFSFRI